MSCETCKFKQKDATQVNVWLCNYGPPFPNPMMDGRGNIVGMMNIRPVISSNGQWYGGCGQHQPEPVAPIIAPPS